MAWVRHTVSSFFGIATKSFRYKTMRYEQSCFPCSLHVILRNMFPGGVPEDDGIERLWNTLQQDRGKPTLDQAPPNEDDVHRNLQRTPQFINRISRMKFISPTSFQMNFTTETFEHHLNVFLSDPYRAALIGDAHATVLFKVQNNIFIHFNPAPTRAGCRIARSATLDLRPVPDGQPNRFIGARFTGDNPDFVHGGSFILLVG